MVGAESFKLPTLSWVDFVLSPGRVAGLRCAESLLRFLASVCAAACFRAASCGRPLLRSTENPVAACFWHDPAACAFPAGRRGGGFPSPALPAQFPHPQETQSSRAT